MSVVSGVVQATPVIAKHIAAHAAGHVVAEAAIGAARRAVPAISNFASASSKFATNSVNGLNQLALA